MTEKEKSIIQENLSTLYLRLNGYLTTGFIIHKNQNNISGELDILAVRFPNHKQDDTKHNSSEFLEVPQNIDLIIGEVKSSGKSLQFNNCLRTTEDVNVIWTKILKWVGILEEKDIEKILPDLIQLVQTKENSQLSYLKSVSLELGIGRISIRPIIFSPERNNINNADKFITWNELNDFIWMCLCPDENREICGTRYDFTAWGTDLYQIVKVYKDRQKEQRKFITISELYSDIENLQNANI
jgi:hypothetical protein